MTFRIRVIALLTALLLGDAIACGGPPALRILAPAKNAVLTWMPVDIGIDLAAGADLGTLVVQLNGTDVTSLFTLVDPPSGRSSASAEDVWDGIVLPGANLIEVDVTVNGNPLSATRSFDTEGDAFGDAVVSFTEGTGAGYGEESWVLGPPKGSGPFQGSLDVLSLGVDGEIEVEFVDNVVVDGPGVDLIVFENAFLEIGIDFLTDPPFSEPGEVSVSQDGVTWFAFSCALQSNQGPYFPGCAGVYPVLADGDDPNAPHGSIPTDVPIEDLVDQDFFSFPVPEGAGGDAFDLADVGLAWAKYVRIRAADFSTGVTGPNNAAFDLDAVAAVNSAPAAP